MENTHTQIVYHIVFAVKNRESLIIPEIKEDLYQNIIDVITSQKQSVYIINGTQDHIHMLINCRPNLKLTETVRQVKELSSKFINNKKILSGEFCWQVGFGAFSVSRKDVPIVIDYIENQVENHKNKTFHHEYVEFLKENEVEFREGYLFDFNLK